jgi:hypothetical protein
MDPHQNKVRPEAAYKHIVLMNLAPDEYGSKQSTEAAPARVVDWNTAVDETRSCQAKSRKIPVGLSQQDFSTGLSNQLSM